MPEKRRPNIASDGSSTRGGSSTINAGVRSKEMKTKIKIGAFVLAISIVGCLVWVYRPYAKPDLRGVDPRVRDLQEPLKSVRVSYFLDGGSISLQLVDARGTNLLLAVPVWDGVREYGTIFLDTRYPDTNAPGVKVVDSQNTALHLQHLLRDQPGIDTMRDVAVEHVGAEGLGSAIRLLVRRFTGQYARKE